MISKSSREKIVDLINSDKPKDLHIHSYYSDGELSPSELVDLWMKKGFGLISITDHDVIEGSKIALEYAEDKDIIVIPGIEFDSQNELGSKFHILGYGMNYDNELLKSKLATVRNWRDERNDKMLKAFAERGHGLSTEEIYAINCGRFVGKPTFAKALVNRGDFPTMRDAFDIFISKIDEETKIKKMTLSSSEVVKTIQQAEGVAILAHPIEQKKINESWDEFKPRLLTILDTFLEYGIDGIECYHPSASEIQSEFLVQYAKQHNLIISCGSDFHSDSLNRDYSRFHK